MAKKNFIDDISVNTIVGPGALISGNITVSGFLRIDGDIDGNIQTQGRVIIGEEAKTLEFSKKLFENGLFIGPIVFPTVPKGTGRVRCMVTAGHTTEQLDRAIAIFEKVGKEMGIIA